jgi:hypothetical protein
LVRSLAILALLPILASAGDLAPQQQMTPQATQAPAAGDVQQPTPGGESKEPGQATQPGQPPQQSPSQPGPSTPPTTQKVITTPKQRKLTAAEEFAKEMKSCMDAWDSFTRMTKAEWRQTCNRTLRMREYQPDVR